MRLVSLALLVLLAAACDSTDDAFERVDFAAGRELRYTRTFTEDTTAAAGGAVTVMSGESVERVVAEGQTLGALRGLTVVESETREGPFTYGSRTWYRPTDSRLEEVAYEFFGDGPFGSAALRTAAPMGPALPHVVRLALARRGVGLGRGDDGPFNNDTTLRATPRVVLEYPTETGRTWTHFDFAGEGLSYRSTREVVRTETVTTAAGTFACVVVRSRLFFGAQEDPVDWLDWIADVGLVRRTATFRQPRYSEDGTVLGAVLTTENVELVAVER